MARIASTEILFAIDIHNFNDYRHVITRELITVDFYSIL